VLRTRIITAVILLPLVIGLNYLGGLPFLALVTLLLSLAEAEFCRLATKGGFHPTLAFGLGMVWLFLLDAQFASQGLLRPGLALILLVSLTWQLCRRQGLPVVDWALGVAGGLYLGVCGASMVGLRSLDDRGWWLLLTLFAIMSADSGAYFVGRAWGRRKLAPSLSPAKTWEGYLAGIVTGGLGALLIALLQGALTREPISITHGLTLGFLIATLAPVGDLVVSMIKRQVGAKDSGNIIPGHGGALDRLDSILWAAVIGHYYVLWIVN
jgi:phosphatidate cytidylyltransferase